MEDPQKSLQHLTSVEKLGEEIVRDKSELVALDQRRNWNREALRALAKSNTEKAWMSVGPLLVKMPSPKCRTILEGDQATTEAEINKIRSELKVKVNQLRDLEFQDPVPGLFLKPLARDEFSAVAQALGKSS